MTCPHTSRVPSLARPAELEMLADGRLDAPPAVVEGARLGRAEGPPRVVEGARLGRAEAPLRMLGDMVAMLRMWGTVLARV